MKERLAWGGFNSICTPPPKTKRRKIKRAAKVKRAGGRRSFAILSLRDFMVMNGIELFLPFIMKVFTLIFN